MKNSDAIHANALSGSWAKRLWRSWYWRREYAETRERYGSLRRLIYFGGQGIGDELLCSAPLHELRRRGETGLGVMTSRPELFAHSPDVDAVHPMRHQDVGFLEQLGVAVSHTGYIRDRRPPDIDVPPTRHLLEEMAWLSGVRGEVELRPYLWLTEPEKTAQSAYRGCIAIQSSRQSASLAIGNKEWFTERFQDVVHALKKTHRIVQLGLPSDPPLTGVEDLRGRANLRETAAVLSQARAFVGLVGFLMHLARAVDCPAVIVYGGRERPDQSGYVCNENLYTALPCAPCWRWNSCDFDRRCMREISAPRVIEAVEQILARPRQPLPVDRATLLS